MAFLFVSFWSLAIYLLLTAGSGPVLGLWPVSEVVAAVIVALLVGASSSRLVERRGYARGINPLRILLAILYALGPFFLEMAKANLDVAYRVITGRIRPGIVRAKSGQTTDVGTMLLANSITLTPGTLTVAIDEETNDLYVHVIHLSDEDAAADTVPAKDLFSMFDCPAIVRRIVG